MPKNRRPRDREEKSAEIVTAAASLFTDVGFEKTSLVSVAKAAGVTSNTIYWYFDSKEALLVAVLDHLLAEALTGIDEQTQVPLLDQLVWVVDRLEQHSKLVTTVHTLATTSTVVEAWHNGFHALTNDILAEGFRQLGVPEPRVQPMTRLGVFAIEGLLMHSMTKAEQEAVLAVVVNP